MKRNGYVALFIGTTLALLAACGGGGGGGNVGSITPPDPPEVLSTVPTNGSDFYELSSIVVVFSEEISAASVTGSSVIVVDASSSPVAGYSLDVIDNLVYLRPPLGGWPTGSVPLTITLTTAIKDLSGLGLVADYVFSATPSATAPVTFEIAVDAGLDELLTPADASIDVALNSTVSVTFTTPVDFTTVPDGIKLFDQVRQVTGSWAVSPDNLTVTFTPDLPLAPGVSPYTISFNATLKDVNGASLAGAPTSRTFSTIAGNAWVAPDLSINNTFDRAWIVAVDASGNIIICGSTAGIWEAGASAADRDAFVAKFSPDGTTQWIRQVDINGDDDGYAVAVDRYGYVYLAGSTGALEGFVTRIPPNGSRLAADGYWQKVGFTGDSEELFGIAVDWSGNVFATGYADDSIESDPFTVKLQASNGTVLGLDRIASGSGTLVETANGITYDPVNDAIYVVGDFTADIDTTGNFTGGIDAFLIRYENDASLQTFSRTDTQIFGGSSATSDQFGLSVSTTVNGDIVMGGLSTEVIDVGPTDTFAGIPNVGYMVKFSNVDLSETWRQEISGDNSSDDAVLGLAVDGNGLVYGAGSTLHDFPGFTTGADSIYGDGYILQYGAAAAPNDYVVDYLKPLNVLTFSAFGIDVEMTPAGKIVFLGNNEIDEDTIVSPFTSGDPVLRLYDNALNQL